jgi:hypothetical protein
MRHSHASRGYTLLGMAAIIFIITMLTWTMMERSFGTYHVAAQAEARLQAHAAAQGVMEFLSTGNALPSEGLEIGPTRSTAINTEGRAFQVAVYRTGPEPVARFQYQVTTLDDGTSLLERQP